MRIDIRGDKIKITEGMKTQIEEKIGHLDSYFKEPESLKAYVVVRVKNNEDIIEVTVPTPKFTLRSETSDKDFYAALNTSIDKLERQIRKNKTKLKKKFKDALKYEMIDMEIEEEQVSNITKRKELTLHLMDEEEAVLQMELLGHDFYIFKNSDTDNVSVVYKRKDGEYGIINTKYIKNKKYSLKSEYFFMT